MPQPPPPLSQPALHYFPADSMRNFYCIYWYITKKSKKIKATFIASTSPTVGRGFIAYITVVLHEKIKKMESLPKRRNLQQLTDVLLHIIQ